jgi:hypothetical protein
VGRSETPSIDELRGPGFVQLDSLRHDDLLPFAARYFFDQTSWITWLHHALSIGAVIILVSAGVVLDIPFFAAARQFALGFAAMFLLVLPIHEALHAAAYAACGARRIQWKILWRYLAAYVVAERFVASRAVFLIVALAPFVIITPALIVAAVVWPAWAVFWLTILLWHTAGVSGDWALMNYYWLNRQREIFTYDEDGWSYFFERVSS